MKIRTLVGSLAFAGLIVPGIASATDGYFSHGYGMKAAGMGGASLAIADDAMGGANNPASMVFAGDRLDLGLTIFSPHRSASRTGSCGAGYPCNAYGAGAFDNSTNSGSNTFYVPELGYNHMLASNMSVGVTIYGNGGMNTDYPGGTDAGGHANMLGGTTGLGIDLQQLIIAPTFAYKFNANNAIGISPLFGYQMFAASGLQGFSGYSSSPSNLTNNGHDTSTGWGVRVGWMGKVTDRLSLGAAYASKMDMSSFNKYQGLFADGGKFDIPENYGVGLAYKITPQALVALDYMRINYSQVGSIGDQSTSVLFAGTKLGASGGPGFGWSDVNVWKLGFEYALNDQWTLRAGYNHSDNPIQASNVVFNILAPGVVQDHYTLGATYKVTKASEITAAYMHAMQNSVTGPDPVFGGTDTIKMYEDSFGVAYDVKF